VLVQLLGVEISWGPPSSMGPESMRNVKLRYVELGQKARAAMMLGSSAAGAELPRAPREVKIGVLCNTEFRAQ
jgi:hypothetical protein